MNLVQITASEGTGGADGIALRLHRACRDRGHRSWLVVGSKDTDDPGIVQLGHRSRRSDWARACAAVWDRVGPRLPRRIRGMPMAVAEPRRWSDLRQGRENFDFPATRRIFDLRPDLVHAHTLHGDWLADRGFFDLRILPELTKNVPLLLTLHDNWLMTGHCLYTFECERWRTGCGACPHLDVPIAVPRDATAANRERKRRILERSRYAVASPSRWLLDRARQSILAAGATEFRAVPNGIDLSVFRPGAPPANDVPTLLFAATSGHKSVGKDFDTLRAAVELLADLPLRLVVLGSSGPDGPRIRFVPFVRDRQEVAGHYRAADLYVHAARMDNFPTSILEAMACGIAVVASRVGGIPEQLPDEALVPPGDPRALAGAIRDLLRDREKRLEWGRRNARIAAERFGLERHVEAYLSWYEELTRGRGASGSAR